MRSVLSRLSEASTTRLVTTASEAPLLARIRIDVEAELGGDHDVVAEGLQGFAHEFLVGEWAVDLGGVEEGDATLDGRADQRDPLVLVCGWAVAEAQSHAAEPDG
jgi:hypothetical protein